MHETSIHKISSIIKSITILTLVFVFQNAFGQYDDTAVWRKNNVKKIESWVHFMAFENSNDTCLFEEKFINKKGLLTLARQDYNCHGSAIISETKFTYDSLNRVVFIESIQNDILLSQSKIVYNAAGQIVDEENIYLDELNPAQKQILHHQYYGSIKTPDSLITTQIVGIDTTVFKTTFEYQAGKQTKANMVDKTHAQPISKRVNKYDAKGRMLRDQFILMQSYDQDEIVNFTYNDKGQVFRSQSEISKIAGEFYYNPKGLLTKTFYYNKFESLEREVWHRYTFWE